jgi:hypothetical protein
MNRSGVISVQLDRELRTAVEARRRQMRAELGRDVRDAEMIRVLLRQGLGQSVSLGGYVEGWRAGMAEAKETFARGVRSMNGPAADR